MRRTRLLRVLGRAGLLLAGLAAGLALVEVALRVVLPQEIGLRWYTREGIMVHVPGLRGTYVRPEFRTRIEIDSDGLRDREYPLEKAPGIYRILVLGDSLTAGIQVPAEQTFCKRIEAILREGTAVDAGSTIEVINAGVSGYGTADELRYLEAYGARWKPDLVLVAFYPGNDVMNNLSESHLSRDAGGRIQVQKKPLTEWQYRMKGLRSWLASHSHLFQLLRDRLRVDEAETLARPEKLANWRTLYSDTGSELGEGWTRTLALLDRIAEVAHGLSARTAIVLIPSPWQNDPASIETVLGAGADAEGLDLLRPGQIVCEEATRIGAPCLDLLPGFRAAGSDRSFYWKLDGHFTSKGHAAAADLIARFLREHALLPGAASPGAARHRGGSMPRARRSRS